MAFREDSLSSSDRIQLKFNQPNPKNPNVATVVHVIETGARGVGETYETDSQNNFGDVDDFDRMSSDAGQPKLSANSSTGSQKPLFLIKSSEYLSGYKERVLGEQIEKYEQVRRAHMVFRLNGWESEAGAAALERAEQIVRAVYEEQCVKVSDLQTRDQVIERIKDAFYNGDSRTQSYLLEGEITISATGSCMNGL